MQAKIDEISNITGYAISVGYYNSTLDFGIGSGAVAPNSTVNATGSDTFLFGSGTKPYTAAAIMRLVD
jgi:CubicO group peptidase (beta-lactamase class C family)